jgi:predicted ATPase
MSDTKWEGSFEADILTPDRRVRVFVSSTLNELRDERDAARRAIEGLHLTPVMFEAGARAHPPRDLYRAYLAQSDVFVGIYGDSYGWVAPGMEQSGLEDEYRLSGERPRLIYVRESRSRDSRLTALIDEIADAGVSYRRFGDSDELARLLVDDLAVLLSERFYRTHTEREEEAPDNDRGSRGVPMPANKFIGREAEVEGVIRLITDPDIRLVTISGPGGVGKSRLALEVAARLTPRYENMTLTLLEEVRGPEGVISAILSDIGISESALPPLDALKIAVADRPWLFVLDNFEHVVAAATDIVQLLEHVPTCQVLATSRVSLGIRAEHVFTLDPLAVPEEGMTDEQILSTPSVELFLSRAEAAGSRLMGEDVDSLSRLTRLLEGVPLSLELAAGRARLLPPRQILQRLEQNFGFLGSDAADLPERHRSIEATIQWSFDLLTESEAMLAGWLSVFEGGFTMEGAEGVRGEDVIEGLSSLVAKNLVRVDVDHGGTRFSMLKPIRDHAARTMDEAGLSQEARTAHARHFLAVARTAADGLRGPRQIEWIDRLSPDDRNVMAAIGHASSELGADVAAASLWDFYPYLEYMGECREAMTLGQLIVSESPGEAHLGRTLSVLGLMSFWLGEIDEAYRYSVEAVGVLSRSTDEIGLAYATGLEGTLALMGPEPAVARVSVDEAVSTLEALGDVFGAASILTGVSWMRTWLGLTSDSQVSQRAVDAARKCGSTTELAVSLCNRGLELMRQGRADDARALLAEGLQITKATASVGLETLALASVVEVVADSTDPAMAVTLASTIESARTGKVAAGPSLRWTGIPLPSLVVARLDGILSRLRAQVGPEAYQKAWDEGQHLTLSQAAERAFQLLQLESHAQ